MKALIVSKKVTDRYARTCNCLPWFDIIMLEWLSFFKLVLIVLVFISVLCSEYLFVLINTTFYYYSLYIQKLFDLRIIMYDDRTHSKFGPGHQSEQYNVYLCSMSCCGQTSLADNVCTFVYASRPVLQFRRLPYRFTVGMNER